VKQATDDRPDCRTDVAMEHATCIRQLDVGSIVGSRLDDLACMQVSDHPSNGRVIHLQYILDAHSELVLVGRRLASGDDAQRDPVAVGKAGTRQRSLQQSA
jgi:hypothetical protein